MSKTAAVEFGALAAVRQAPPTPLARKPHTDFGAAFERAERQVREPEPTAREAIRPDALVKDQPVDAPAADEAAQAPKSEAPADDTATADARAADAAATASAAEAAADAAAQAPAEEPLSAEAALALMIATGVTAGPVVPTAAAAADAAQAAAGAVAAAAGAGPAAGADELAALLASMTPAEAGAPVPKVAPTAGTGAAATATDVAAELGLTGLQVTTQAETHAQVGGPATSSLALAEEAADDATVAVPVAAAPPADDATGAELLAPAALTEEGAETLPADGKAEPTLTPSLNGDRQALDGPRGAQASGPAQQAPRAEDVLPQVLKHAEALKSQQNSAIKLQLYPEHLGKMEIRVVSHMGVLSAQLTADSQNVKAMLEGQVVQLQRSLQEMGLKIDKVEVTLASADLGGFDMSQPSFADQQGQGSGQPSPQAPRHQGDAGYGSWLGDDQASRGADAYAVPDTVTAIDYVA